MAVVYHPRAQHEVQQATYWYAQRSLGVAARFVDELLRAETKIQATPEQWPRYFRGTRYFRLKRFPYLIVYRLVSEHFQIVAVAHTKRRPYYWSSRLN